ncbi:hypothetical protein [Acidisoma silvae]|uniref:SH3 domain-containing protein n=1 Tax=Acidisoma silvae TaxID=2802396 RepID=A0A963YW30_9PROT|nr:hypothetical protein [Acidisoma silvae]MCB8877422.1 hypothetical protein [Acidisoma silvae]
MTHRLTARLLSISILAGLAGCVMPPQSSTLTETSMEVSGNMLGSLTPVYTPPAGTPFRCTYIGPNAPIFSVPGDIGRNGLGYAWSPVATMGARRGDWLLVVTRTGVIGWVYQPHEVPTSESPGHWIRYCNVHQDEQGRIVFHWKGVQPGEF